MKLIVLFLVLAACVFGQEPGVPKDRKWEISAAAVAISTAADLASSRGLYETNPLLGRGKFGKKQALRASLATAGVLTLEWLLIHHNPKLRAPLTKVNIGITGVHGFAG